MAELPELTILIPVFNEETTIAEAVRRISKLEISKEIIVVDDCSTDNTSKLLSELKNEVAFTLIRHEKNQGKGAGVIHGIEAAQGTYFIVEDADLELDPQDILKMLKLIKSTPGTDLVNGKRALSKTENVNTISKVAALVTGLLLKLLYGSSVSDLLSSYKICRLDKLKTLNLQAQRFTFETEWLIKAMKKGWKIIETDINYYPRHSKAGKKINWWDGVEIIWSIIRLRFSN